MTGDPFRRLAPFIREFIYARQWTELRAVQVEACRIIFETDCHLLLATGTASGKTEAAFMPVLTLLSEDPPASVGALYIGPLKALINDQFARLEELLKETDIPVWHWHGDVAAGHKKKLLRQPRGVLQITPESMESMLINRPNQLAALFADLRFVVVDEVHALMSSDRGRQVLCQLSRLNRYMRAEPRRIGLSATLAEPEMAARWLACGTSRPAVHAQVDTGNQTIRIGLEHFVVPADEQGTVEPDATGRDLEEPVGSPERYVFDRSLSSRCLVFANSRADVESVVSSLRQIARRERAPDIYHAHHGSIAAPLRHAAEQAMKDPVLPAVTAATVTLELGIDIGQLERVIQLEAPFSVASFVQRLGRSGRRGAPPEIWIVCAESAPCGKESLPELLPWSLLQAIAIIELYVEERWLEPVRQPKYPFTLLYQQTMSTLASCGGLSPAALAQRVLTLPPFAAIGADIYREFLRHLMAIDHIERTESGHLIVGLVGERVVRDYRFYATFAEREEYAVVADSHQIGSITSVPPVGERFALAGHAWEVLDVDDRARRILARRVEGRVNAYWQGGAGEIHTRILRRMRAVLGEDNVYPYLGEGARQRLAEARAVAREAGVAGNEVFDLSSGLYCLLPWLGTVGFRTLQRMLNRAADKNCQFSIDSIRTPYYMTVSVRPEDLGELLRATTRTTASPMDLLADDEAPEVEKHDRFVAPALLRMAFAEDHLDVSEAAVAAAELVR